MDAYAEITRAYEGVEAPGSFSAPGALASYRAELLSRSADQVAFLRARMPHDARVLEIASGNGRLLIALAQAGALAAGTGIDVARSRIAFAEHWAADEGLGGLEFAAEDVLAAELPGDLDVAVCITGALAYFEPMRAGAAAELLATTRRSLRPGGLLVLELYPHPEWRAAMDAAGSDELRTWYELAPEDPWRFYLSDVRLDRGTGVLTHRKIFVNRTSGAIDDTRREHLKLYELDELTALLGEHGFEQVEAAGGWLGEPYGEATSQLLVVTATAAP